MLPRIAAELALLRKHYAKVDHVEANGLHWFHVEELRTPPDWSPAAVPAVFSVTQGYPGAEPYGFFVPSDLRRNDAAPADNQAPNPPPFNGSWRFLSWQPVGWRATGDLNSGSNLWGWVRSFVERLREGQ